MCPVWVHDRRCMEEEQKDWLIGQLCFSICCPYYLGEETSAITPWVWQDLDVRQAFEKDHREMLKERLKELCKLLSGADAPCLGEEQIREAKHRRAEAKRFMVEQVHLGASSRWLDCYFFNHILVSGTWMFGTATP